MIWLQVQTQSVITSFFTFYLERWQRLSCLIQEARLSCHLASLFHQHAARALSAAPCVLPTQHLFDLILSLEIDGWSVIEKITQRRGPITSAPLKCQRARSAGSLSPKMKVRDGFRLSCLQGNLYERSACVFRCSPDCNRVFLQQRTFYVTGVFTTNKHLKCLRA